MNKHTPGSWIAYELAPEDPSWGACEIWPAENDREDDEGAVKPVATMVMGLENARLIAAAPEMLEALIAANAELEMWRAGFPNHSDSEEVAVMIDEAISKATGESA